jgi:hypothetical protein
MKVKSLLALVVATILWIPTGTQGEPRFVAQTIDSDIQIGYGLAVGDVNGDGKDDILLADKRFFSGTRIPLGNATYSGGLLLKIIEKRCAITSPLPPETLTGTGK